MEPQPRRATAFTLIELLVVVSIIAVLAGMLLPAVGLVRASSKQLTCLSNLRQFQLANLAYANDNDGTYVAINKLNNSTQLWYYNQAFVELLDQKNNAGNANLWTTGRMLCPVSWSSTSGLNSIMYSYGANADDGAGAWMTSIIAPVAGKIARPGDKIAFADAWDWWIISGGSHEFDVERQPPTTGYPFVMNIAYRHNAKVGIVFYDGHSEAVPRSQVDTGAVTGTARAAMQKQIWYLYAP